MAWYNSQTNLIEGHPPKKVKKGWYKLDCGCCNGLQWGTGFECPDCGGNGLFYWHKKSKVKALYIGGPLLGKENINIKPKKEVEHVPGKER